MHLYTEKPGDAISKQLHPNGALHVYTALNNGIPANGWSSKKYYPTGQLEEEENYSNGLLIEKISYDESGLIISHKIWNIRLKQLIDKPAVIKFPRPNVICGCASLSKYLDVLPAISKFIRAEYNKEELLKSFDTGIKRDDEEWTMAGEQISFSIYWDWQEVSFFWQCHCKTEELYWRTRKYLEQIFQNPRVQ